jgi:hypothetical protein
MKPQFTVRNVLNDRTIYIRLKGRFSAKEMRDFANEYKRVTDTYGGASHLVLADMRGMVPTRPEVGQILASAIHYARDRGVYCCAHVSDDSVQRLQAARLARRSASDEVTVDVVSEDEARAVLNEARGRLARKTDG